MKKQKKTLKIIPCGVALIQRNKEFLIGQRMPEDTYGGYWEFPGGKKNPKETFENCVVREIDEELGVKIEVHRKLMEIKKRFREKIIWLNFFICSYVSGDPKPIECQNVRWVNISELKNYTFPPANHLVIKNLIKIYGE